MKDPALPVDSVQFSAVPPGSRVRQEGSVEKPAIACKRKAATVECEGSGVQDGNPHRRPVSPSGRPPGVVERQEFGHGSGICTCSKSLLHVETGPQAGAPMIGTSTDPRMIEDKVIEIQEVWKIFGEKAEEALDAVRREGIDKAEVLERYEAVVGVRDVSFDVNSGEIFCVMGLSGSGKSTLVRHINRLIEPTHGQILINGEDVGALSPAELRALRADRIGMVFQNMALLPHRTVRDNIAFALELRNVDTYTRHQVADRVIETVSLQGYGDRMPSELSGGMQQRVGLARALAADPEILLMDEPFSALDPLIRRGLQDEFLELSRTMRKTTIFITHDLDEAIRMGSRIAIMKDGEVVQIGTPEYIVTNPADEYVADFVQGISRLKLVFAHTIMKPPGQYEAENGDLSDMSDWPEADPEADLDRLVNLIIGVDKPIAVRTEEGQLVGIVTKDALLRGIQGEA